MRSARNPEPSRLLKAIAVVALLLGISGPGAVGQQQPAPAETPEVDEAPAPPDVEPGRRVLREARDDAEERKALDAAHGGESPEQTPAASAALAGALERVRRMPAPANEAFALVRVTDRNTGEQRVFTRGVADPSYGLYLEDPGKAPEGKLYSEMDSAWAEGDIEVAIRAVLVEGGRAAAAAVDPREEAEQELRERNAGSGLSFRIESELRRALRELPGSSADPIPVMLEIKDVPRLALPKVSDPAHGGLLWAGLDVRAERERAMIERKQRLAELQRPVVAAIEQAGGQVAYASWTSGSIQALLPPASIEPLADCPGVLSLEYIPQAETHSHRYLGDDIHIATNAEDYNPSHEGWNGLSSKHGYTSRIVLAMSEECVQQGIPPWRTGAPGTAVRGQFWDLDPGTPTLGGLEACVNDASHPGTGHAGHKHGHWVLGTMTGDFMDGQEAVLTATQRRQRTGTCEECFFLFGQDFNLNERTKAHDWACSRGADIFQSSIGFGTSCDGNGPFDSNLQSLINCDVAYVQSAANSGSLGGCTTSYPADHPWTFSVGGVDTEDPCDTPGEYYTGACIYEANASKGGTDYDSCSGCADINDLAGPYRVCHGLDPNTSNPTGTNCLTGTSFASPTVAGLMARTMDWYRQHVSNSIFYDNRVRNWMLLMGDRSAGADGTGQWLNTTDPRWGAGRARLEPFDDLGCWSIFRGSVTLGRGDSYTFSDGVPSCAQFYKAVVWHTGTDYSNEPMIRLTLNPTGCSTATSSVDRLDAKTLLKMSLDGCTGVDITIRNVGVGSSGTRKFHIAAYGKSGFSDRGF